MTHSEAQNEEAAQKYHHKHYRELNPQEKAHITIRLKRSAPTAQRKNTDRWTEILFRALTNRVAKRWRLVSFRGMRGGDWKGIVDVLAIRKDTAHPSDEQLKCGDLFDIILVQMKGGSSKEPSETAKERLLRVQERYGAKHVVLFTWKRGLGCKFSILTGNKWAPSSAKEIFE